MAKLYRTSAPPPGEGERLRNTRLYGGRDEQIATAALRSRGCPNPDRAVVVKPRKQLRAERSSQSELVAKQAAQVAMLTAQRAVRDARAMGASRSEREALARVARIARREYLRLTGGVEVHEVTTVAVHADRGW